MEKPKSLIVLKDVAKYYHRGNSIIRAVDGISLEIKSGEFVAIMGPSGSGKSTAMNLIGSLDTPTKGEIYLGSHNISHLSESDLAQVRGRKIGYLENNFYILSRNHRVRILIKKFDIDV
ncbi:MAG: ATP-binding cassette domain-containing protein, partial [Nanoarchaeota archaeon]|nr:ATP-binding cassette domain-containing protein [Nanoarchaeota archaeon]